MASKQDKRLDEEPSFEDREAVEETASPDEPVPAGEEPSEDGKAAEEQQVEHDLDELLARARERDEYLSLAQRTQADFENYRKRMARETAAAEQRGVAKLARELLPALDNLRLALEATDAGEPEGLADGVKLIQNEIQAALGRVGIEEFSPQGEPFDPNEHEAMARQPVEGAEPGTVVEVYQRGYRYDGTVLRPARVVVAE